MTPLARRRRGWSVAILASFLTLIAAAAAHADFSLHPVEGSFDQAANAAIAPGDEHRLFVVERPGRIQLVKDDRKLATPFLDFSGDVALLAGSEQGLASVAFAPDYATSGRFYVYFSAKPNGDVVVREYRRMATDPDRAEPTSGRDVLHIQHSGAAGQETVYAKHYGGHMLFGPDGLLYIAVGDGGDGDNQDLNSQDLNSLKGKILRIDPADPDAAGPRTYGVPPGNPFVDAAGADEIWMSGLRNPYRFSFDPVTSDMLIGDVGGTQYEELDSALAPSPGVVGGAGLNWGWAPCEGFVRRDQPSQQCPNQYAKPLLVREHASPQSARAITAGVVVRDPGLPSLLGRAIYTEDAFEGVVRSALLRGGDGPDDRLESGIPAPMPAGITAFTADACNRVYFVRLFAPADMQVVRLQEGTTHTSCGAPTVTFSSRPPERTEAREATFTWTASESASFECRIDNATWAGCTSPVALTGVADGDHTFDVRARDNGGNDSAPFRVSWTVGPPPPPAAVPEPAGTAGPAVRPTLVATTSGFWGSSTAVRLTFGRGGLRATRDARVPLVLRNFNTFAARGSVTITSGKLRLGRRTFRLPAATALTVRVALSKNAARTLRRRGMLRVKIAIQLRDQKGKVRRITRTATLRRAR